MQKLLEIAEGYDLILVDASGVFWGGSKVGCLEGACSTFKALRDMEKKVVVLSNSTSISEKEKEKKGAKEEAKGRDALVEGEHYDDYLTSGQFLHDMVMEEDSSCPVKKGQKYYVLFGEHPYFGAPHRGIFEETGCEEVDSLEEADFIYIGIPHIDGEDIPTSEENLKIFSSIIKDTLDGALDKPLVCANPDLFAPEGNPPRNVIRQGAIANLCKECGANVFVFGKPDPEIFEAMVGKYGVAKERVLMIGDTLFTDILGGNRAGVATALVTETGNSKEIFAKFNGDEEAFLESLPEEQRPTHLLRKFADL